MKLYGLYRAKGCKGRTDNYYSREVYYGAELKDALLLPDKQAIIQVAKRHAKRTNQPLKFLQREVQIVEFDLTEVRREFVE